MKSIPGVIVVCLPILVIAAWVTVAASQTPAMRPKESALKGGAWLNVAKGKEPAPGASRHVTLVHFWTFACNNCQANLPIYDRVFEAYKGRGLDVVGVHTPELEFERSEKNLTEAIRRFHIRWPVLVDNDGENWRRWDLRYWPTVFLVDRKGVIRFKAEGELNYGGENGERELTDAIDRLLAERS